MWKWMEGVFYCDREFSTCILNNTRGGYTTRRHLSRLTYLYYPHVFVWIVKICWLGRDKCPWHHYSSQLLHIFLIICTSSRVSPLKWKGKLIKTIKLLPRVTVIVWCTSYNVAYTTDEVGSFTTELARYDFTLHTKICGFGWDSHPLKITVIVYLK
jgi:hypothetical protein